jgi:hypothetical protein
MGKLIPLTRARTEQRLRAATLPSPRTTEPDSLLEHGVAGNEHELWPIAALLFVFSAARVAHALLRHEPFDTEPTLALLCVLGLPAWGWQRIRKSS